ncbi:hypothetical protein [Leptolyngbya sp. BL0902]|uniref:hypothetical protein n=1 Tax=Leptolyngbya sp. BL0902 TaxID=1115757 RepID=UPI0018E76AA9|nr:hypothetical protein [Leptolyngbya sp. BL0902]
MKNLNRNKNQAQPPQIQYHNWARQAEELESRRKQVDDLFKDLIQADEEIKNKKHELLQADEEIERQKQAVEQVHLQLTQADEEITRQKQAFEEASLKLKEQHHHNQQLLQRLKTAIQSRNSMRGRLGNIVRQHNRVLQQVNQLMDRYKTAMQNLKTTTEQLGKAYQKIHAVEAEYDQDMTEIARAYQDVSFEQRAQLPEQLRQILEKIEQDYTGIEQ